MSNLYKTSSIELKRSLILKIKKYPSVWTKKGESSEDWKIIERDFHFDSVYTLNDLKITWAKLRGLYFRKIFIRTIERNFEAPTWPFFHDMTFMYTYVKEKIQRKLGGISPPLFRPTKSVKHSCPCCINEAPYIESLTDSDTSENEKNVENEENCFVDIINPEKYEEQYEDEKQVQVLSDDETDNGYLSEISKILNYNSPCSIVLESENSCENVGNQDQPNEKSTEKAEDILERFTSEVAQELERSNNILTETETEQKPEQEPEPEPKPELELEPEQEPEPEPEKESSTDEVIELLDDDDDDEEPSVNKFPNQPLNQTVLTKVITVPQQILNYILMLNNAGVPLAPQTIVTIPNNTSLAPQGNQIQPANIGPMITNIPVAVGTPLQSPNPNFILSNAPNVAHAQSPHQNQTTPEHFVAAQQLAHITAQRLSTLSENSNSSTNSVGPKKTSKSWLPVSKIRDLERAALIEAMKAHPAAYDPVMRKNSKLSANAWEAVSRALNNTPIATLKQRWRVLKGRYLKELVIEGYRGQSNWEFFPKLEFFRPFMASALNEIQTTRSEIENSIENKSLNNANNPSDVDGGRTESLELFPNQILAVEGAPIGKFDNSVNGPVAYVNTSQRIQIASVGSVQLEKKPAEPVEPMESVECVEPVEPENQEEPEVLSKNDIALLRNRPVQIKAIQIASLDLTNDEEDDDVPVTVLAPNNKKRQSPQSERNSKRIRTKSPSTSAVPTLKFDLTAKEPRIELEIAPKEFPPLDLTLDDTDETPTQSDPWFFLDTPDNCANDNEKSDPIPNNEIEIHEKKDTNANEVNENNEEVEIEDNVIILDDDSVSSYEEVFAIVEEENE